MLLSHAMWGPGTFSVARRLPALPCGERVRSPGSEGLGLSVAPGVGSAQGGGH